MTSMINSDVNPQLKQELCETFSLMNHTKKMYPHLGKIAPGEFHMLSAISSNMRDSPSGVKTSVLGEGNEMSRPAVSQMLNALEKKGFIERVMTPEDRRVVLVKVTPAGQTALNTAHSAFSKMSDKIIVTLGDSDTRKFIEIMAKLHQCFIETQQEENLKGDQ